MRMQLSHPCRRHLIISKSALSVIFGCKITLLILQSPIGRPCEQVIYVLSHLDIR
jgi:hypothetical protein